MWICYQSLLIFAIPIGLQILTGICMYFNLIDMTVCDTLENALSTKILFIQAKHQTSDSIPI